MLDIMTLPVTRLMQNCRILAHQETCDAVVVDPGGNASQINEILKSSGLRLTAILLTHGHIDHVGGTAELIKLQDHEVKLYGPHPSEAEVLGLLEEQAAFFNVPLTGTFTPEFVGDGEVLQLFSDASFTVLHTPGHTPGGVCYYCKEENFILTGDTIFAGSIGRTDFHKGSHADLIEAIKTRILPLPDETEIFSGHGEDSTVGEERLNNPFLF